MRLFLARARAGKRERGESVSPKDGCLVFISKINALHYTSIPAIFHSPSFLSFSRSLPHSLFLARSYFYPRALLSISGGTLARPLLPVVVVVERERERGPSGSILHLYRVPGEASRALSRQFSRHARVYMSASRVVRG